MAKAQVIVTVTTEALIELPQQITDVDAFCREYVSLDWGPVRVRQVIQSPSVTVEYFLVEEPPVTPPPVPEAVVMPVAEVSAVVEDAGPDVATPVMEATVETEPGAAEPEVTAAAASVAPLLAEPEATLEGSLVEAVSARSELLASYDDPMIRDVIVAAVRSRAERLIEEIVSEVVTELEPLLRRHHERHGAH